MIKQKLLEKGANTLATLPKVFKSMPSFDGKSRVNVTDFFNGLAYYGLQLRKEDSVTLVRFLIKDSSEMIDFDSFLFAVRGKPNEERQSIIDLVYYKFDKNKLGYAEATELRKVFNCIKHPRYLMGEYTEDQIFYLFLKNFSDNVSGTVTKKVFYKLLIYYRNGMTTTPECQLLLMTILISSS